jgi:signal transduction histidine kinase
MTASPSKATALTCPQCHAAISPDDVTCQACGANIAMITLMAEREMIGRTTGGTDKLRPVDSLEQLVPRLGEYLLRNRYINEAQLQAALARQASNAGSSQSRKLGQTLVEMGVITHETLDQAIAQQILELQTALVEANRSLEERVTERTAELEAALVKLTEFNQLKANFVANISHELRTPLSQIKGYTSLLADSLLGPLTTDQVDALNISTQAIERLERLINDLIRYATTAKGELTLHLQPVSLSLLAARVIDKSREKAQKQNVALASQLANLPPVLADEEKLYWSLLQLVDNAVKFTPSGGRVTLSATEEGQRVRITVRDTGIGIPANRVNEIFEPFRQLDGSSTRRYGGTGLGLALVRRIVEAHGSQVHVESKLDQGSAFSFTLGQPPKTETKPGNV